MFIPILAITIPVDIPLSFYNLPTIYVIDFIAFSSANFTIWYYGKKDGFDEKRLFDMAFSSLFLSVVLYLLIKNNLNVFGFLAGTLIPVVYLSGLWKWSYFRILDIFSLAWCLGFSVYFFGAYLIYIDPVLGEIGLLLAFIFWLFVWLRERKQILSGLTFSSFLIILPAMGLILRDDPTYLIFYTILFTLSLVNLYYRAKKYMTNPNTNLSAGFLQFIKDKLTHKEKELKAEQNLLLEEDPYLKTDRAVGNSEDLDEALLEDAKKDEVDNKKISVGAMQALVQRALAMLRIGKYGVCEVCGQPIDKARLKAFPEATTCFEHANHDSHR